MRERERQRERERERERDRERDRQRETLLCSGNFAVSLRKVWTKN